MHPLHSTDTRLDSSDFSLFPSFSRTISSVFYHNMNHTRPTILKL